MSLLDTDGTNILQRSKIDTPPTFIIDTWRSKCNFVPATSKVSIYGLRRLTICKSIRILCSSFELCDVMVLIANILCHGLFSVRSETNVVSLRERQRQSSIWYCAKVMRHFLSLILYLQILDPRRQPKVEQPKEAENYNQTSSLLL